MREENFFLAVSKPRKTVDQRVMTTSRCADERRIGVSVGRITLLNEQQCWETAAALGLTYGGTTPPEQNFPHGCVRPAFYAPPQRHLPCEAASECAWQRARLSSSALAAARALSTGRTPKWAG